MNRSTVLPDRYKKPLFLALVLSQQIFNVMWYIEIYAAQEVLYMAANAVFTLSLILVVINYGFLPAFIAAVVARIPFPALVQEGFSEVLLQTVLYLASEAALLILVIILVEMFMGFKDVTDRIVMFAAITIILFLSTLYLYPLLLLAMDVFRESLQQGNPIDVSDDLADLFSGFQIQVKEYLSSNLMIHLKFNVVPNAVAVFAASAIQNRHAVSEERY